MRIVLIILLVAVIGGTATGFYIKPDDETTGNLIIGISVVVIFFVLIPLFIYFRWNKRSFKDYMLTKENIDKMREEGRRKKL
ncbi:MAG: hypothetical protein DWP94_11705 [Flavobacterium sp.]|nr:MAG: hypothetical protein DWP94_11705 [Flavobacterium sp.]